METNILNAHIWVGREFKSYYVVWKLNDSENTTRDNEV